MTFSGWFQIAVYAAVILALTKPVGLFLHRVFVDETPPLHGSLGLLERLVYRLSGVDPRREQTWWEYAAALLVFSLIGIVVTYAIERLQGVLPFNPQRLAPVEPLLALNTAVS